MNTYFLVFVITECVSIFAFTSLAGIFIGITNSAVGLKICIITAEIKKYKSVIKKKKKKHNKIVQLAKARLNNTEILISRALIDSYLSHNEFFFCKYCLKRT